MLSTNIIAAPDCECVWCKFSHVSPGRCILIIKKPSQTLTVLQREKNKFLAQAANAGLMLLWQQKPQTKDRRLFAGKNDFLCLAGNGFPMPVVGPIRQANSRNESQQKWKTSLTGDGWEEEMEQLERGQVYARETRESRRSIQKWSCDPWKCELTVHVRADRSIHTGA